MFFFCFISHALTSRLWGILKNHIFQAETWITYFLTYHLLHSENGHSLFCTSLFHVPYPAFFPKKTKPFVISSKPINISMETSLFHNWLASIWLGGGGGQWNICHGNISNGKLSSSALFSYHKSEKLKLFQVPKSY